MLISVSLFGQTKKTQTITGTIKDAQSGQPLIGATIKWTAVNDVKGVATNTYGSFILKDIPVGRQDFICEFLGYKSQKIAQVLVTPGKETVLSILMTEQVYDLETVIITDRGNNKPINSLIAGSVNVLEREEILRFSGSLGDISRMAQNYAGVSGASDNRNDIIVRGNSPATVLWRLNGIDIPSPNHWASIGTSGGPISMLNTNNLKSGDFITGAFPAEYGNVTGAVFDLNLRKGNTNKFEFLGQIGFNGFEAGVEGPLKFINERASFFINYRYSTLEILKALGIDFGTGDATPNYQDLNFDISIPTESYGTFNLWGLGGNSKVEFLAESDDGNLFSNNEDNLISKSQTNIVGLQHTYFFTDATQSKLSLARSKTRSQNTIEEIITAGSNEFEETFIGNQEQQKLTINWTVNLKITPKHAIKVGANYDHYNLKIKDSTFVNNQFWFNEADYDGTFGLYRAFGQWNYKVDKKWTLNAGVNTLYLKLNNAFSLEPRASISYKLNEKATLALAYGNHAQMQPLPLYFNKDSDATDAENQQNETLDFMKSNHYVFSYQQSLSKRLQLKTEIYYQHLYNIAVDPKDGNFSAINLGADFSFPKNVGLVNQGTGRNYGIELTLQRGLHKGLYYLVTASLFNSTYKGFNKQQHDTYYNSNYVLNGLIGKEFQLSDNYFLTLDGRFTYAGGRRFTPIDLEASIAEGEEVLSSTNIFQQRYAAYIRPDFKIGLRIHGKKTVHVLSLDFQNFINRRNEFFRNFRENDGTIETINQRGFFPDIRYQILFN